MELPWGSSRVLSCPLVTAREWVRLSLPQDTALANSMACKSKPTLLLPSSFIPCDGRQCSCWLWKPRSTGQAWLQAIIAYKGVSYPFSLWDLTTTLWGPLLAWVSPARPATRSCPHWYPRLLWVAVMEFSHISLTVGFLPVVNAFYPLCRPTPILQDSDLV